MAIHYLFVHFHGISNKINHNVKQIMVLSGSSFMQNPNGSLQAKKCRHILQIVFHSSVCSRQKAASLQQSSCVGRWWHSAISLARRDGFPVCVS